MGWAEGTAVPHPAAILSYGLRMAQLWHTESMLSDEIPSTRAMRSLDKPARYLIVLEGRLDEEWADWFGDFTLDVCDNGSQRPPTTTLTGVLPDQAALRGLLGRIWDLNLVLVAVTRLEDGRQN